METCARCNRELQRHTEAGHHEVIGFGGKTVRTITWNAGDVIPCGCRAYVPAQTKASTRTTSTNDSQPAMDSSWMSAAAIATT